VVASRAQSGARRAILAGRTDAREQQMFGGLTFMVAGQICCGIHGDELIVRLRPEDEAAAVARQHARPMDLTGRPMCGFVTVVPAGVRGRRAAAVVQEAVVYAESRGA
jgi:TfoX N-terminal domain